MGQHVGFFVLLGKRIKLLRKARQLTQEDMIMHGFSARHWQMIEAGRPITMETLLRICDVLKVVPEEIIGGIYEESNRSTQSKGKNK